MSRKTNNKNGNRKPKEDTVCQDTNPGKLSDGKTTELQNNRAAQSMRAPCKKSFIPDWTRLEWATFVGTLVFEILVIVAINCISEFLDIRHLTAELFLSIACLGTLVFLVYTIRLNKRAKQEISNLQAEIIDETRRATDAIIRVDNAVTNATTKTTNYIDYSMNGHIKVLYSKKELVISKQTLKKGLCDLKHTMQIHNFEKGDFANYVYDVSSTDSIANQEDYEIKLESAVEPLKKTELIFKPYGITYDEGKTFLNGLQISIPVMIKGGKTDTITIHEKNCPCFKNLSNCAAGNDIDDWLSIEIRYPTDLLRFELKLDQSMRDYRFLKKRQYTISDATSIIHPDMHKTNIGCVILDGSDQVVTSEMDALDKWENAIPEYFPKDDALNKNEIVWEIQNPKIGYIYQLYFTLSKVDKKH